jgi:hypothetical protein
MMAIIRMDQYQQAIMNELTKRGYVPDFFEKGNPAFWHPKNDKYSQIYFQGGLYCTSINHTTWGSSSPNPIINHLESLGVFDWPNSLPTKGVHDG